MKKIIARYVALLEIDVEVDAERKDILPFNVIRNSFQSDEATDTIRQVLYDEVIEKDIGKVTITKMYGDAYIKEE